MPGGQFLELLLLKWSDFDNSKIAAGYFTHNYGLDLRRPGTILHHKVEINDDNINDPEVTLSHANLAFFCIECHNSIHQKYGVTREDVRFDERGQLVEA